ncbi:RNA polymerase sigma factor CnrH [Anaerohalosphaera lusitana]|uniref:RNA polymerase sigma factor CnrH n=1 Tax=Anaerohalosphaera lusitana TaxID=1936003 RepID=A0A1U9NLY4_9BACT|nr:sigma-70 family RNA polymerase sigma factor [Anaerohalosphaera lusitana]AQT68962.1 RNA polymerase sigma factor CnrH [Anaerohalosphaera lusitana]
MGNIPADNSNEKIGSPERFIKLVYRDQRRIFAFILTLVPNYSDAEDVMQDCLGVMWRKFGDFEPGTDFAAWGMKVAHYLVMDYRRKKAKKTIQFNDKLFRDVAEKAAENSRQTDKRVEALRNCIKRLRERERKLVNLRYFHGVRPQEIAKKLGLSLNSVYKSLSRTNSKLLACVEMKMGGGK